MPLQQQIKFDSMDVAYKSETKFMDVCMCVFKWKCELGCTKFKN